MNSYIYVITNKENNKKYVGKTSQDPKRKSAYKYKWKYSDI